MSGIFHHLAFQTERLERDFRGEANAISKAKVKLLFANWAPISLPEAFPSLTMGNPDLILSNLVGKSPGLYQFL